MNVHLIEITAENWIQAVKLEVKEDQKNFVASNAISIAQSKFDTYVDCHGIYDDDTMIGFSATGKNPEDGTIWIIRHMVGKQYQGKGYGKLGLQQVIEMLVNEYDTKQIFLTVEPENSIAITMYKKAGFIDTGEKMVNSHVFKLLVK